MTGARLSEILTLQWSFVDFQRAVLTLPDSKTGQKIIFLSRGAIEVLRQLERDPANPFVIKGSRPGTRLVNLQKPWTRIRRQVGLDDVRLHDLRHSFASLAAAQGASLPLIGALLGHNSPQTTQRYAHLVHDQVKELNESVNDQLASMRLGGNSSD